MAKNEFVKMPPNKTYSNKIFSKLKDKKSFFFYFFLSKRLDFFKNMLYNIIREGS